MGSQVSWEYRQITLPKVAQGQGIPLLETPETQVRSLGWEAPLEKEMATLCSLLA